ncbi:MAG: hypothetical protein HC830_15240 [Bacteroidetes bacterium]|nr:hypothetical protein [Bacteroidota bacterium]
MPKHQSESWHVLKKQIDANGEILSVACFLVWNMRIFYLAGASSPKGKQVSSMFLVFDKLIRDFASTGYLIDFEGSMSTRGSQVF